MMLPNIALSLESIVPLGGALLSLGVIVLSLMRHRRAQPVHRMFLLYNLSILSWSLLAFIRLNLKARFGSDGVEFPILRDAILLAVFIEHSFRINPLVPAGSCILRKIGMVRRVEKSGYLPALRVGTGIHQQ